MKKISFIFLLLFCANTAFNQVVKFTTLQGSNGKVVTKIVDDSTLAEGSHTNLATEYAIKQYILHHGGVGGGGSSTWGTLTGTVSDQTDLISYLSSNFATISHLHSFASLTSKPTTVGGYGITDFNSLGDARWAALGHNHTFGSLLSLPTTIAGYGITDAVPKGDSNLISGYLTQTKGDARYLLKTGAAQVKYEPSLQAYTGHTANLGMIFINNNHGVYFGGEHRWNYGGYRLYMPLANTYDLILGAKITIVDIRHGKGGQIDFSVYDLGPSTYSISKTFSVPIRFRAGIDPSFGNRFFIELGDSTTNWGDVEVITDYELVSRTDVNRTGWFTTPQSIQLDSMYTGTKIIDTLLPANGVGGGGSGSLTSVSTTSPLTGGTITTSGTIGITQATTSTNGYLSSMDWNTFNGKQSAGVSWLNDHTNTGSLSIGTSSNNDFPIYTNNIKRATIKSSGEFLVGTDSLTEYGTDVFDSDPGTLTYVENHNFDQNARTLVKFGNKFEGGTHLTMGVMWGNYRKARYFKDEAFDPAYTDDVFYAGRVTHVSGSGFTKGTWNFSDNGAYIITTTARDTTAFVVADNAHHSHVGIGTYNPEQRLDVYDSTNSITGVQIRNTYNGTAAGSLLRIGDPTTGQLLFYKTAPSWSTVLGWGESGGIIRNSGYGNLNLVVDGTTTSFKFWLDGVGSSSLALEIKPLGIINYICPDYADNAAAIAGGLVAGDHYRTGDVEKVVH